jgi:hypothetical protein
VRLRGDVVPEPKTLFAFFYLHLAAYRWRREDCFDDAGPLVGTHPGGGSCAGAWWSLW